MRVKPLYSPINPLRLSFADLFFRDLPNLPGVYKMYDEKGGLLYVGKAKCLKDRLTSYRSISPLELPKKVYRLIQQVKRIEYEVLESETAALIRENFLLRTEKPPFNRRNTRPENYLMIGMKVTLKKIEIFPVRARNFSAEKNLKYFGCFKKRGLVLDSLRVIEDWANKLKSSNEKLISDFLSGRSKNFVRVLRCHIEEMNGFDAFEAKKDLETIEEFFRSGPRQNEKIRKKFNLESSFIAAENLDDLQVRMRRGD